MGSEGRVLACWRETGREADTESDRSLCNQHLRIRWIAKIINFPARSRFLHDLAADGRKRVSVALPSVHSLGLCLTMLVSDFKHEVSYYSLPSFGASGSAAICYKTVVLGQPSESRPGTGQIEVLSHLFNLGAARISAEFHASEDHFVSRQASPCQFSVFYRQDFRL